MATWENIREGERVELGLVQVDIVGHSQLVGSDRTLQEAKSIFREQMEGIALSRQGRPFHWAGDGGAFMFLTGTGHGFDDLGFSAIQMLQNLPAISEEITIRTDLNTPIAIRISCDAESAAYHPDPGQITADFINRFFKNERAIGLTNTVSITERVWRQLSARLRERFRAFKYSPEVESQIYNYGGKERQLEILSSLRNIDQSLGSEKPTEDAECVEIVAFAGDTLTDLSKTAYRDVIVEGFANVGGLNLLITKNAELCQRHRVSDPQSLSSEDREYILQALETLPQDVRQEILYVLQGMTEYEREHILHDVRRDPEHTRYALLGLLSRHQRSHTPDPLQSFDGGESLRFYNCTALGYVPVVGEGTLLDHVLAGNLVISRVVGGVVEPVVKKRVFVRINDIYHELRPQQDLEDYTNRS